MAHIRGYDVTIFMPLDILSESYHLFLIHVVIFLPNVFFLLCAN